MAKKIVSLLCALAMLVTMVSLVATFTASADHLQATAMNNFAAGTFTYTRHEGAAPGTAYSEQAQNRSAFHTPADIYGLIAYVKNGSNTGVRQVTVEDTTTYDLSNGFSASWSTWFTYPACTMIHTVSFGKLDVKFDRSASGVGNYQAKVWLAYDGTVISDEKIVTFPDPDSTSKTAMETELKSVSSTASTAPIYKGAGCDDLQYCVWGNFAVSFNPANNTVSLTITNSDDTTTLDTLSGTIESPNFTAAKVKMDNYDLNSNRKHAIFNFRGTYQKMVSDAMINVNANGGSCDVSTLPLTGDGHIDAASLPVPTNADIHKNFTGWYTEEVGGTAVNLANSTFDENDTIWAHWDTVPYVNLNGNGGLTSVDYVDLDGSGHPTSLPNLTRKRYTFDGWFDAATGGNAVTETSVLASGSTIYAHWTLQDNDMGTFSQAKVDNGRYVNTATFPDAVYTYGGAGNSTTTAVVGNTDVNGLNMKAFTIDTDFWFRDNYGSGTAGNEEVVLTVGDLEITLLKNTAAYSGHVKVFVSAKYGTTNLTFTGDSKCFFENKPTLNASTSDGASYYSEVSRDSRDGADSATSAWFVYREELLAASVAAGHTIGDNFRCPNVRFNIVITYTEDNGGTLTLTTPMALGSNAKNWSVSATGVGADFTDAQVSFFLQTASSNVGTVVVDNFSGVYTPKANSPFASHEGTLVIGENTAIRIGYDQATYEGIDGYDNLTVVPSVAGTDYPALTPVLEGSYYRVKFDQITPNLFGDNVTFTLKNGDDVIDTCEYSVLTYCNNQINASTDATLVSLCENILAYGAYTAAWQNDNDRASAIYNGAADFSDAVTSPNAVADYTYPTGDGFALDACLNLRDNVSLVIKVDANDVPANGMLYCTGTGIDYILTPGAKTEANGIASYVIPIGIANAYTDCEIVMKSGANNVSKVYTLSIAKLAVMYMNYPNNENLNHLGEAILCYATAMQNYIAAQA